MFSRRNPAVRQLKAGRRTRVRQRRFEERFHQRKVAQAERQQRKTLIHEVCQAIDQCITEPDPQMWTQAEPVNNGRRDKPVHVTPIGPRYFLYGGDYPDRMFVFWLGTDGYIYQNDGSGRRKRSLDHLSMADLEYLNSNLTAVTV